MKVKQLFNLLIQTIAGKLEAKGTGESGHEGEALVQPTNPEYTGKLVAKGTQESGHEGEVSRPTRENPVHTPVVGSSHGETETQAIGLSYRRLSLDDSNMWMKRLSSKVKKVAKKSQKIYQTIDGVKAGEPTIVSEVPQPRKLRRG